MFSNKSYFSDSWKEELSKRAKRKTKRMFFQELDQIRSNIVKAYEISNDLKDRGEDWLLNRDFYSKLCEALSMFSDVTGWLHDLQLLSEAESKEIDTKLRESWAAIAKEIINALNELTETYTTYEDSLGMADGDNSISNLFLNAYGRNHHKYSNKPYFSDSLGNAAEILFENNDFELACRYALMAAIEAIWNSTDWEDAMVAFTLIPREYEKKGMVDESVDYSLKILRWLYSFYSELHEQEGADIFIVYLQSDLVGQWDRITSNTRKKVVEFWKDVINSKPCFYNQSFILPAIIDTLVSSNRYNEACKIVKDRIANLTKCEWARCDFTTSEELLQNLGDLAELGFSLKDKNLESLTKDLDKFKSKFVENKVSELAFCMGYNEAGEREWIFKNPVLQKFMKDKQTRTVELDMHQRKREQVSGKEREILFLAECRYRNKPSSKKDIEFLCCKVLDLLEQKKEECKKYPSKIAPKVGELWFVSIHGFKTKSIAFEVNECKVKLIDGDRLNKMLAEHNIQKVPIVKTGL